MPLAGRRCLVVDSRGNRFSLVGSFTSRLWPPLHSSTLLHSAGHTVRVPLSIAAACAFPAPLRFAAAHTAPTSVWFAAVHTAPALLWFAAALTAPVSLWFVTALTAPVSLLYAAVVVLRGRKVMRRGRDDDSIHAGGWGSAASPGYVVGSPHKCCTPQLKRSGLCKSRTCVRERGTGRTCTLPPSTLLEAEETPAGTTYFRCY